MATIVIEVNPSKLDKIAAEAARSAAVIAKNEAVAAQAGAEQSAATIGGFLDYSAEAKVSDIKSKGPRTDVRAHGAGSSKTAAENRTAIIAAIAAVPLGGTLWFPAEQAEQAEYLVDTTEGLSAAVLINKTINVVVDGNIKANYGTMQANPPYIFKVTADNVSFSGNGKIIGNGTIDDTNAGTDDTMPGLIYVSGNNFSFTGVTIDTPPKIGIELYSCKNAKIHHSFFTGGPSVSTPGNTAYFAVRSYLGSGHSIDGNTFSPDALGGMYVNCIFTSGTTGVIISGNTAESPYEKLAYINGDRNLVIGNTVNNAHLTDVFRLHGSYNQLIGNKTYNCLAGAQVIDGICNEIIGNQFINVAQVGINVNRPSGGYAGGFSGTKIIGNTIIGDTSEPGRTNGIMLSLPGSNSENITITGNTVTNMALSNGQGLISVVTDATHVITNANISNNVLSNGKDGIVCAYVNKSRICDNVIANTTEFGISPQICTDNVIANNIIGTTGNYGVVLSGGSNNKIINNQTRGAVNKGVGGTLTGCSFSGNTYTDIPLTGSCTLSAAITTTVAHGGVAPEAIIMLQEKNTTAGIMIASKGRCVPSVSAGNFTIAVANGTAAAGTEQFYYEVIQ